MFPNKNNVIPPIFPPKIDAREGVGSDAKLILGFLLRPEIPSDRAAQASAHLRSPKASQEQATVPSGANVPPWGSGSVRRTRHLDPGYIEIYIYIYIYIYI